MIRYLQPRITALVATTLALLFFAGVVSSAADYDDRLDSLKDYLDRRGYDSEDLFASPNFEIYDNIDSFFKNSAESKGIRPVNKAKKEQGKAAAAKVFVEQLAKYKEHIGFEAKKGYMDEFLEKYIEQLTASEKKYGVPKELTAAIIGLESLFGRILGRHLAFNVYVSMYVKGYKVKWATEQLDELLRFARKRKRDVFVYNSSYAGAIGPMQFLPWSLNRWFVGENVTDMEDCIMSAANYIAHFKKQRGTFERAVFAYNPSKLYVQTILDLAAYAKDACPEKTQEKK